MDLGIGGRTALVTAASGGLGLSIASALAAEGADLVLFSRSRSKLDAAAARLTTEHGVRASTHAGDLTSATDLSQLAATLERLDGPDIVVLVTGRPPTPLRETLAENEAERWQQAYDNQLASVVNAVNAVTPLMLGRGWGRVVAITSAHAKEPMAGHALSAVFRAGTTAYIKGLAAELAPHGITANCVAPALIDTSHRTGTEAYTDLQAQERSALSPLGRMGTQEELAATVAFLASRQAGFITGTTVTVDGGLTGSLF
jgi:3-oxoacyl-[acyl-carrier protein] reductase